MKIFEHQIRGNKCLEIEDIEGLSNKEYHNGEPVRVGDKPLFSLLETVISGCHTKLEGIMIKEEHLDMYYTNYPLRDSNDVPVIRLKENEKY